MVEEKKRQPLRARQVAISVKNTGQFCGASSVAEFLGKRFERCDSFFRWGQFLLFEEEVCYGLLGCVEKITRERAGVSE